MDKYILVGLVILNTLAYAKVNDFKVKFSNEAKLTKAIRESKTIQGIEYKLADILLETRDNKFRANVVVKGKRTNTENENTIYTYRKIKIGDAPKVIKGKESGGFFDDTEQEYEQYGNTKYKYNPKPIERIGDAIPVENAIFKDPKGWHIHDDEEEDDGHHHHHHHHHNHNHDEEHEHGFKREGFATKRPKAYEYLGSSADIQAKIDIEYFNGKLGARYIQYLTDYTEDEKTRFAGDAVYQFKNINVIKDKFSISFIPRLYTRKIVNPLYADIDIDARYKIDDESLLGAFYYQALQLEDFKNFRKTKSKIDVYFDNSTEEKEHHKFYEIVDHEHEKKTQHKLRLSYEDITTKRINIFSKNDTDKYDSYDKKTKKEIELKIKESDFIVKGLSISNNIKIVHNMRTKQDLDRKYKVENFYKFKSEAQANGIFKEGQNNITQNNKTKVLSSKLYKNGNGGFELQRLRQQAQNEDDIENGNTNTQYLEIIRVTPTGDAKLKDKVTLNNNVVINNDTTIGYEIDKNSDLALENKLEMKRIISSGDYDLKNNTSLTYNLYLKNFRVELGLENIYNKVYTGNSIAYQTNTIRNKVDVAYRFNNKKTKLLLGAKITHDLDLRKADNRYIFGKYITEAIKNNKYIGEGLSEYEKKEYAEQEQKEGNKWVRGNKLSIKPYLGLEYVLTKNLKLNTDTSFDIKFEKTAMIKGVDGQSFNPVSKVFIYDKTDFELKAGLNYYLY